MCSLQVHKLISISIMFLVGLSFPMMAMADPPGPDKMVAMDFFSQGEYKKYLDAEASPAVKEHDVDFLVLTSLAISIDKTDGWGTAIEKRINDQISASADGHRYLTAYKKILGGDFTGLNLFFVATPPSYGVWGEVIPVLRKHGYENVADVFSAIRMTGVTDFGRVNYPVFREGVRCWVNCAQTQRKPLDDVMFQRFQQNSVRAKEVTNALMKVHIEGDDIKKNPDRLDTLRAFELAMEIGKPFGVISLDTARRLFSAKKTDSAFRVVDELVAEYPTDAAVQIAAAQFVWWQMGDISRGKQLYQKAIVTIPEPNRRVVRLAYFTFLSSITGDAAKLIGDESLKKYQYEKDPIVAADAFFVGCKLDEAANRYRSVLMDNTQPIDYKISAWGGLLQTKPSEALITGEPLIDSIAKDGSPNRTDLLRAMGNQLWLTINWTISTANEGEVTAQGWELNMQRIDTVPQWEHQAAILAEKLIACDRIAMLCPSTDSDSVTLRLPIAVLLAMDKNPEDAFKTIKQEVDYQAMPPKWGWRDPLGIPTPDTDKPRIIHSPAKGEHEQIVGQLLAILNKCPHSDKTVPPLAALIIDDSIATMKDIPSTSQVFKQNVKVLSIALRQTVNALDPLLVPLRTDLPAPDEKAVDISVYKPIDTKIRELVAYVNLESSYQTLLREGILESMLIAHNHQLLDQLTSLMCFSIEKYAQNTNDPARVTVEADYCVRYLEGRKVFDMIPYSTIIRNKFLGNVK